VKKSGKKIYKGSRDTEITRGQLDHWDGSGFGGSGEDSEGD
jgi:hypothetical protein